MHWMFIKVEHHNWMSSLDLLTGFIIIKNEHTKFTTKENFSQTLHKNEISTRTRFWQRTYNFHSFMLTFSTQKKLISDVKVVSAISSDFYCQEIMRFLYFWSNFREKHCLSEAKSHESKVFFSPRGSYTERQRQRQQEY